MPSKRKKKKAYQRQNMIAAISAVVIFAAACGGGAAAFLLNKNSEETEEPSTEIENPVEWENSEATPPASDSETDKSEKTAEPNVDETTPEDELIPEEEFISFNKPDKMRGVVVNAGTDFLTDPSKSDEVQQKEIDAMLASAENYSMNTIIVPLVTEKGTVFSVDSIKSISSFDALDYLIAAARDKGLFVYGVYDVSLYGKDDDINRSSIKNTEAANLMGETYKDFVKKYDLDGILLDGCENPVLLFYFYIFILPLLI